MIGRVSRAELDTARRRRALLSAALIFRSRSQTGFGKPAHDAGIAGISTFERKAGAQRLDRLRFRMLWRRRACPSATLDKRIAIQLSRRSVAAPRRKSSRFALLSNQLRNRPEGLFGRLNRHPVHCFMLMVATAHKRKRAHDEYSGQDQTHAHGLFSNRSSGENGSRILRKQGLKKKVYT